MGVSLMRVGAMREPSTALPRHSPTRTTLRGSDLPQNEFGGGEMSITSAFGLFAPFGVDPRIARQTTVVLV